MKKSLPVIHTLLLCGILSVALAFGGFIASKYVSSGSSPANETITEQPVSGEPAVTVAEPVIPEAPAPEPQAAIEPVVPNLLEVGEVNSAEERTGVADALAEVPPSESSPRNSDLRKPIQPLTDIAAVQDYLAKLPLTAIGPKGILVDRDFIAWGGKLGPEDEITLVRKVGANGNQVVFSAFGETVLLKF